MRNREVNGRALARGCWLVLTAAGALSVHAADWEIQRQGTAIQIADPAGTEVARYQLAPEPGSSLSVESGCFFHPVRTPNGVAVTDLAPDDHRHHRGIFLAFVEVHGKESGDFWGWGEPAPIKNRRIVNRKVSGMEAGPGEASFEAENEWLAEERVMVREKLTARVHRIKGATALDLTYRLRSDVELKMAHWAFSGFCARLIREGTVTALSPSGPVGFGNPRHDQPVTDWPEEPWYAFDLELKEGERVGVAVLDHPENPPTWWHNHRDIRMLNPSIVAPHEVVIRPGKDLVLRYRVLAYDGAADGEWLDEVHREWGEDAALEER